MAFGQIDPARLDGDALRRWYLRSPADIEEERRQKTASAYDAFFSRAPADPLPDEPPRRDEPSNDRLWASSLHWKPEAVGVRESGEPNRSRALGCDLRRLRFEMAEKSEVGDRVRPGAFIDPHVEALPLGAET